MTERDDEKILEKRSSWIKDLNISISLEEFTKSFKRIYVITNVNKYRSFQFRLLHRGLLTNVILYKWNIVESPMCTYCQKEPETILHLFTGCSIIKGMWLEIKYFMNENYAVKMSSLEPLSIIFNKVSANMLANFVCLLFKQYIYRQRCLQKDLSLHEFKSMVHKTENLEKYIAIKRNKINKHNNKWRKNEQ